MYNKTASIYGLTTAALIVAIVVIANVVSMNMFGRIDLTEGKIYSLNAASKEIVANLDDEFLVKAYFSKDLPPPYNQTAKFVQDQLDEYKAFGKGRFRYVFVDPADDAELEQEAQQHRIPPVQVQVVEQDQFQAKRAYLGLVFLYQDRQETIPVVDNPAGLEYEITATIKKLTSEEKDLPKIGFLTGHSEPDMSQISVVQQVFTKQYRLTQVDLSSQHVPDDIEALIIASPRSGFSEWEKYAIDQYIMRGGKVAFLIDKVDADLQTQRAAPIRLGMEEWFANYGFGVNDDLLADLANAGGLTVTQQEGFFRVMTQVVYPYIPNLRSFNKSNVMVKDLERISLYYVSSVDTSKARDAGVQAEPLLMSSETSKLQTGTFNINPTPNQEYNPDEFDHGQQVVAAIFSGSFRSAYDGQPIPARDDTTAVPSLADSTISRSPETRILVMGDGEFFIDQKGGQDRENLLFFQNMVDWMVQDEALIAIRSRDVTDRPLKKISEPKKKLVKYANMFGSPILIIVFGLIVWQMRRRRTFDV